MLLGDNRDRYFFLLFKYSNAGTYYTSSESIFVCERSNREPSPAKRKLIRARDYGMDDRTRERTYRDSFSEGFDLTEFLSGHEVHSAYFYDWPLTVAIDDSGMYFHWENVRAHFMNRAELHAWVPHLENWNVNDKGKVVGLMETVRPLKQDEERILYYVVRSGSALTDIDHFEGVIPVPERRVRSAIDVARDKVQPIGKHGR